MEKGKQTPLKKSFLLRFLYVKLFKNFPKTKNTKVKEEYMKTLDLLFRYWMLNAYKRLIMSHYTGETARQYLKTYVNLVIDDYFEPVEVENIIEEEVIHETLHAGPQQSNGAS